MTYYLPIIISGIIIFTALMWWLLSLGNIKSSVTPPTEVTPPKAVPAPPVAAAPPPAASKAAPPAKLMDDPKPASKTAPAKAQAPLKAAATKSAPAKAAKPATKTAAAPKAAVAKPAAPKPAAKLTATPKAAATPKPKVALKAPAAPKPKAAAKPVIPDNLELLKGVGPKLNSLLKSMGISSFDQVANWTATDIAEVDAKLGTFAGRIRRDNWTDQAKLLLAGDVAGFEKKYGALGSEITKG